MNRSSSVNIVIVIVVLAIVAIASLWLINSKAAETNTIENHISTETSSEATDPSAKASKPTATEQKKAYTGFCAVYGKYRQRYVECTGDYDPAAKAKAEAKAKECNESDKAVSGCTNKYQ